MPEALVSAITMVFSLIGLITVIYNLALRLVLFGKKQKILLVLPTDDRDKAAVLACANLLEDFPMLPGDMLDIRVATFDENELEDILETDTEKQV